MSTSESPILAPNGHPVERLPREVRTINGMTVARKPIFRAPLTQPRWQLDMLLALQAAKRLGVQTFEIEVSDGAVQQERRGPQQRSAFFFLTEPYEGETWKTQAPGDAPEPAPAVVTIYAVVVE